ncbi:MAG: alpha-glucan family phosphorylase [Phycisphaeraceae bacterium]|nr:alpha-glucan family phosphorylase [Phycisphaeraceae bacterium]MCW5755186.1 alpha-glucan family phosphorylase [Phycisphaeraceae bacterium]
MPNRNNTIAYFSMEIGLESSIPTYSGGLGVLAGDTIRAAADLGLPFAAVTLLYREGYFRQKIDERGRQIEEPVAWRPEERLEEMPQRVHVPLEGRNVYVRCFRLMVTGHGGAKVPIYFLDTDVAENDPRDRMITHALYAGDTDHRIRQEAILGIGGRRMLRAVTHDVTCFHMNEGHAFLVIIELLSEYLARHDQMHVDSACAAYARERCVFTTHTPIPAGHDRFNIHRVRDIVGDHPVFHRPDLYGDGETLNTTVLALNFTRFANGVARRHAEVSREMFPGYAIAPITNGVHASTWVGPSFAELYDRHVPQWRQWNSDLRLIAGVNEQEILAAHAGAKQSLLGFIRDQMGVRLDPGVFTVAFARRATAYKRPSMILSDLARLRHITRTVGPVQVIYAGKAHPHDGRGKEIIAEIVRASRELRGEVEVVFVPNYDIELAKRYVAGADLWLNNPEPPLEASGTSGMKAALNGVPSLSTMDGWWIEGCAEGVTGWAIEGEGEGESLAHAHAQSLYDKLQHVILPLYYRDRIGYARVMRRAAALNGSYFTTERMVREYALRAYFP